MDYYNQKNQEIRRLEAIARRQDKEAGVVHPVSLPLLKPKSIDLYGFPKAKNHKTGDKKPLCQYCGKKRVPRVDAKFCSRGCYGKHVLDLNLRSPSPEEEDRFCKVCDKILRQNQAKFCSQFCAGKGRRGVSIHSSTDDINRNKERVLNTTNQPILTEQEFALIADSVHPTQINHAKYLHKQYGRESARNYLLLVTNSDYWNRRRNSIIVEEEK